MHWILFVTTLASTRCHSSARQIQFMDVDSNPGVISTRKVKSTQEPLREMTDHARVCLRRGGNSEV